MLDHMVECMCWIVQIKYLLDLFFVHIDQVMLSQPVSFVPDVGTDFA